ncbi:membrane protein [Paenibacillus dendritiformis]|uniref:hypothetical protein n=1 Tax=Paenibacillus dendritiformis TaxID=130049 RepID=UPI001B241E6A|nr:hypothetical protein [Paenibacillus dendritiformis]GIO73917.1 membrane protein [Paenibacillus dendritiformis]
MTVALTGIHAVYLLFVALIILCLVLRRDTTVVCLIGIFALGLLATSSASSAVSGMFTSFIYALEQLLGTILIISIIVAMSRVMLASGVNETMISPFTRLMRGPGPAYWTVGLLMFLISLFFWPSPAVALIGAVLLPAAVRVGLPPLAVAMAMNLFGHGIALSGDFVIQGAPKLTADAAGLPVQQVLQASVPLVLVMGAVTIAVSYWMMRRDMRLGRLTMATGLAKNAAGSEPTRLPLSGWAKAAIALLIPLLFAVDVILLFRLDLQGGEATALIGGTAIAILVLLAGLTHRKQALEATTSYLIEGLQFGFKVFGPVIPIAAFFYLGDAAFLELFHQGLPKGSQGIVNDLGVALAHSVPLHPAAGAGTLAVVGAITGLDGSGFSGISLAGSIASLFGTASGGGTATLTALGQIAGIWVGGGTLIPWALIPAAAICGVSPFELARRNLIPVVIGLAATTLAAILLLALH